MISIKCPNCDKKYTFDESIIPEDVDTFECKVCGARFFMPNDEADGSILQLTDEMRIEEAAAPPASHCRPAKVPLVIDDSVNFLDDDEPAEGESVVELTEEISPRSHKSPAEPGFSADRFKYLNTGGRSFVSSRLAYLLVFLLGLAFLIYFVYATK